MSRHAEPAAAPAAACRATRAARVAAYSGALAPIVPSAAGVFIEVAMLGVPRLFLRVSTACMSLRRSTAPAARCSLLRVGAGLAATCLSALVRAAPGASASAPDIGDDIHDIRGPVFILPWWAIPAALTGLVLLALVGYAVYRWWQHRRRPRALEPFEIALERLEQLRSLMEPPRAREFSTAASDIVRTYLELRFEVIATHQTTEEFLHDLLESPKASLVRHRALLSEFLHQCDLVKFAGLALTRQNMESLQASARAFVLETAKPEPHDPLPAT